MEVSTIWYLILGLAFTGLGIFLFVLKELPITTAILYLAAGYVLGGQTLGFIQLDFTRDAWIVERLSEVVVIVSLFTAGLKLRLPISHWKWGAGLRLATVGMMITVTLLAACAHYFLQLGWGESVLLGAILSPTDPVLASDVQVRDPRDRDPLRFALTGEGGLNDGIAFPFVLLGLAIMGRHETGPFLGRWFLIDVLWQGVAGLVIGSLLGIGVARLIFWVRSIKRDSKTLDDFLTVGLICLAYGSALAIHAYGFLAVFAAGLSLRQTESFYAPVEPENHLAERTREVLRFNEQLERLGEITAVVLLGALVQFGTGLASGLVLATLLFLLIRPLAVWISCYGGNVKGRDKMLMSWFGIRGIGSVYYICYAATHGLAQDSALRISQIVFVTIALSILVHGISVTPLMERWRPSVNRRS